MPDVKSDFPEAIFFDFDGIILESADIKTEAFVELFKGYPQWLPQIKTYHLQNLGVSRFKKFEWIYQTLLNKPLSPEESEFLGNTFSSIVFDKILGAPFVHGIIDLLELVKGRSLCFVASGTPEEELISIVEKRKLSIYFNDICGTPRTKQEIVEDLLKKYQLRREDCWFIGDANTDYDAARQTGLNFIARNTVTLREYWSHQKNIWLVETLDEVVMKWTKSLR